MRMSQFKTPLGNILYRNAKREVIEIETGSVVTMLTFKLEAELDTPGAVPVGLTYAGILGLIEKLTIKLQGRDNIIEIGGHTLKRLMAMDFGHDLIKSVPQIVAGVVVYKMHFQLALYLPRSIAPGTTGLDLRGVDKCELFIDWAGIENIYQTPNTAVVNSVSLDVYAQGINSVPAETTFLVRSITENSYAIGSSADAYSEIKVDNDENVLLNSLTVMGMNDGALSQIASGNVRVKEGSFTRIESYSGSLSYNQSFETDTAYEPKVIPFDFALLGDTSMIPRLSEIAHPLVFEMPVGIVPVLPAGKNELIVIKEVLREPRLQ